MGQLLDELLQDVGLTPPSGGSKLQVEAVTSDSRLVGPGSLFVGLPGERVDGGLFWRQALNAGAAAAVIGPAAAAADPPGDLDRVVVVSDPVASTLGELAAAFWNRPSERMALLGVTGTNGKTTTTYLIEHLALACGRSTALFGTLVNRWPGHSITATHTTAFADRLQAQLAEAASAGSQLAAMEISSHALAQQRVAGCHFASAVFTNLTQDHLDYHGTMEAYYEAKARLFTAPLLHGDGPSAVVNSDDPWGSRLAEQLGGRCWRSSLGDPQADLQMVDLEMTGQGVRGRLLSPAGSGEFCSPLLGRFNLMNLLQAVGVLLHAMLTMREPLEMGELVELLACPACETSARVAREFVAPSLGVARRALAHGVGAGHQPAESEGDQQGMGGAGAAAGARHAAVQRKIVEAAERQSRLEARLQPRQAARQLGAADGGAAPRPWWPGARASGDGRGGSGGSRRATAQRNRRGTARSRRRTAGAI